MTHKIKSYILLALTLLTFSAPLLAPLMVAAECNSIANNVSNGANGAAGGSAINCNAPGGADNSTITTVANDIVTVFSIVVGAAAIIMIIYGGFRYITSGGSSDRVGNAKNTLIYAIIGLIIVALAQLIVHFVLNKTSNLGT